MVKKVLSQACFGCGREGHVLRACPDRLAHVHCVSCGFQGHYARECERNRAKGREGACFRCGLYGHQRKFCVTPEAEFEEVVEIPRGETGSNGMDNERSASNQNSSPLQILRPMGIQSSQFKNYSPQEKVNQLLDNKFPVQPVITMKFKISPGMRLVKEHVEAAAAIIGIQESGLVLGMIIEYNFAKLVMNKQKIQNLNMFCSQDKQEIIPGVVLAWARQSEQKTRNVVIKGLDWDIPNSLVKAYLSCFGYVSQDGVKWADMADPSWLAERDSETNTHTKLASGKRLAKITTKRVQIPKVHIMRGKRFYIEHRGQKSCKNCLGDPTECKYSCHEKS